jgi:hypothetical protein
MKDHTQHRACGAWKSGFFAAGHVCMNRNVLAMLRAKMEERRPDAASHPKVEERRFSVARVKICVL